MHELILAILATNVVIAKISTHYYRDKSIPMIALWYHHSVIMDDFLIPGTQQPIIIGCCVPVNTLIIHSSYFLKHLVEL